MSDKPVRIMLDGMSEEPIAIPFPFKIGEYTINNPDDWCDFKRIYEKEEVMDNFPILQGGGITIPWNVAEQAYLGYVKKYGTGQSLLRLAQRGGFGVEEMDEFHPQWREHIRLREENERLKKLLIDAGITF